MKDIKTKGSRSNRVVDSSADLASKMKQGLGRSKDQVENLADDGQINPEEYAQDKIRYASEGAAQDAARTTKDTAKKANEGRKRFIQQIKQKRRDAESIKQTAKSTGKQTFKTVQKNIKTAGTSAHKGLKTAENTARKSIKTAEKTEKAARKTMKASEKAAKASAKAAKKSAEAARKAAKKAAKTAKLAIRATIRAIKAIAAAIKGLVSAIASGGMVAVIIIVVIIMVALIVGSCFGIFYSFGETEEGMSSGTAISDINKEYKARLDEEKSSASYDLIEMRGCRARWREVLAVYAVKTANNQDDSQEVATMTEEKYHILEGVFWDMHTITGRIEDKTVIEYEESADEDGNITVYENEVKKKVLIITVEHLTVDEMKEKYRFDSTQRKMLDELLSEEKNKFWRSALLGFGDDNIVNVAKYQIGNKGGQPYWSWYGFDKRVEWCACFVSWCADRCGYIRDGVIPKFARCQDAVNWFTERGQWKDRDYKPNPGDIIFFDWKQDGFTNTADHVGIVEKVEGGKVYTIEGNSDDQCAERSYEIGYSEILGYGVPMY